MSARSSDWPERSHGAAQSTASPRDAEPLPHLIRRLADEVTTLFAKELALLKSETTAAVREVKTGIGSLATGALVTFAGALFLLAAAMLWLGQRMEMWLAALLVGGAVTLIGLILLLAGRKKLQSETFKPRHTAAALKKDRDMVKGATP